MAEDGRDGNFCRDTFLSIVALTRRESAGFCKQRRWKSLKNLRRIAFLSSICKRFPVFDLSAHQPVHGHKPMRNKDFRKCSEVWQPQRWSDTLDLNARKISDFIYSVWTRIKTDEKFVWLFLNEIESLGSVKDISYCARYLFLLAIRTLHFKFKWTFVRILCFELSTQNMTVTMDHKNKRKASWDSKVSSVCLLNIACPNYLYRCWKLF